MENDIRDYLRTLPPHVASRQAARLLAEAADEIVRLRAIVDKLPTTADGVSVVPGMNVYFQWHSGEIVRHPVAFIRIDKDDTWLYFERALYRSTGVCYSTREAADAAGKDGE
jgi:hypothetical protein